MYDSQMAVDLKYSLPGIATDEPDIYETNFSSQKDPDIDLEEGQEPTNENIDIYSLDTQKAYNHFKEKGVTSKFSDFSGDITPGKRKYPKGFISLEYNLDSSNEETPLEKYLRIKNDIMNLQQELNELAKSEDVEEVKNEEGVYKCIENKGLRPDILVNEVGDLGKQMEELQSKYLNLSLNNLGQPTSNILQDIEAKNFKQALEATLLNKALKQNFELPSKQTTQGEGEKIETSTAPMTFKLFCDSKDLDFSDTSTGENEVFNAKVVDILQRLGKLESVVGNRKAIIDRSISIPTNVPDNNSLLEALSVLQYKVSTLGCLENAEGLAAIDDVCKNLRIKYADLFAEDHINPGATGSDPKNVGSESTKITHETPTLSQDDKIKIHNLYELTRKWDAMCPLLPEILDQLNMLDNTFKKGKDFVDSYSYLEESQGRIQRALEQNRVALEQARQEFQTNMSVIEKNCRTLENRLSNL